MDDDCPFLFCFLFTLEHKTPGELWAKAFKMGNITRGVEKKGATVCECQGSLDAQGWMGKEDIGEGGWVPAKIKNISANPALRHYDA